MNKSAPDFNLADQDGVMRSLADYRGKWLVLYFYPKDDSAGCTIEACAFRDEQLIIAQFGDAVVVGINHNSVASHKKFSDKHQLNFTLLSDPTNEVVKAYGAWRSTLVTSIAAPFLIRRNTYIINPKGKLVKVFKNVNPTAHATEIINSLQELQEASVSL